MSYIIKPEKVHYQGSEGDKTKYIIIINESISLISLTGYTALEPDYVVRGRRPFNNYEMIGYIEKKEI